MSYPMTLPSKDAAAERRQQLAAQLLRGEPVMVTQQGAILPASERNINEVAITVPEGKLATPSLYWYERDAELFQVEQAAMRHFFPHFRADRLSDGRMSWLGSLVSGVPGSNRIWHLQVIYDHDHPHNNSYGGSIHVFPIDPDLSAIQKQLNQAIPHTLSRCSSGALEICTVERDAFRNGRDHSSTAASSLAWAAKWIAAFELWLLGELSTSDFSGHHI